METLQFNCEHEFNKEHDLYWNKNAYKSTVYEIKIHIRAFWDLEFL